MSLAAAMALLLQTLNMNGLPVELNGWTPISASDELVVLLKDAIQPTDTKYRRSWERHEFLKVQRVGLKDFYSTVTLEEFDCQQGRINTLQTSFYPVGNMGGAPETSTYDKPNWTYLTPGTVGEEVMKRICA